MLGMSGVCRVLVAAALCVGALGQQSQQPFDTQSSLGTPDSSTGNFIFNSLAGLLKQSVHSMTLPRTVFLMNHRLPNVVHPNGHTIVPAVIRAHTRLYHAYPSVRDKPCKTEWLAFDEEMSYGISACPCHASYQS
jgi:hypothetical protein